MQSVLEATTQWLHTEKKSCRVEKATSTSWLLPAPLLRGWSQPPFPWQSDTSSWGTGATGVPQRVPWSLFPSWMGLWRKQVWLLFQYHPASPELQTQHRSCPFSRVTQPSSPGLSSWAQCSSPTALGALPCTYSVFFLAFLSFSPLQCWRSSSPLWHHATHFGSWKEAVALQWKVSGANTAAAAAEELWPNGDLCLWLSLFPTICSAGPHPELTTSISMRRMFPIALTTRSPPFNPHGDWGCRFPTPWKTSPWH